MAVSPLGMPRLASPKGHRGGDHASTHLGSGNRGPLWLALGIVLAANAGIMFGIAFRGGRKQTGSGSSFSLAPIPRRVVALLLCALAIEIMALGLHGHAILPPMPSKAPQTASVSDH